MSAACFESPSARLERYFWLNPKIISLTTEEQKYRTFTLPAEEVTDTFGKSVLPELTFRMDVVAATSVAVQRRREEMRKVGAVR